MHAVEWLTGTLETWPATGTSIDRTPHHCRTCSAQWQQSPCSQLRGCRGPSPTRNKMIQRSSYGCDFALRNICPQLYEGKRK